ncbi:hypothetical protein MASR1M74_19400 [Lentimicrobium sp.]
MNTTRKIRPEEIKLVAFLLEKCDSTPEEYPIAEHVYEYEGGVMGSIHFTGSDPDAYDVDLIQAEYVDADGVEVVISLTRDKSMRLLDLDFWKKDFSNLIRYPSPESLGLLRK